MTTLLDAAEGVRRELQALSLSGLLRSPHVTQELQEILMEFLGDDVPREAPHAWSKGYAVGKNKAYFEVRNILGAGHDAGCGCEPCQTLRAVALQLARRWGSDI